MNFNCTECSRKFQSERKSNVHMLFVHGILKPECTNWKLVDHEKLRQQRMAERAKDLIRTLERNLKTVREDMLEYYICETIIREDLAELYEIENDMIKSNYHLPKHSWKLALILIKWEERNEPRRI